MPACNSASSPSSPVATRLLRFSGKLFDRDPLAEVYSASSNMYSSVMWGAVLSEQTDLAPGGTLLYHWVPLRVSWDLSRHILGAPRAVFRRSRELVVHPWSGKN